MDELLKRIAELEGKATKLVEQLGDAPSAEDTKAIQDELGTIKSTLDTLVADKEKLERTEEVKGLKSQLSALQDTLKEMKTPNSLFGPKPTSDDYPYSDGSEFSFYRDLKAMKNGSPEARERIAKAAEGAEGKSMSNLTEAAGGYLINPQISDELIRLRLQRATLRPMFGNVSIDNTDTIQFTSITGGLNAAWVAELGTKTAYDMTFGTLSASTYTAAGMAVVSNQLLANASQIDGLINEELAFRLADLEEKAFINGSGSGQPQGILGTSGINSVVYTDATPTAAELLPFIQEALYQIQLNFFDEADGILMHPRTWNALAKATEAGSPTTYLIGAGANDVGRRASDALPLRSLFGVPVHLTQNVPTNLGAGTNESRIIVGNFKQGLVIDRQGITLDESTHVYFTTNATIFRAEEQVGFTAARYPKAFSVISGTGLIGQ